MSELTIRPTAKFIKAGFILAALAFLGIEILCLTAWQDDANLNWLRYAAPLILIFPLMRWFRRRFTKAVIAGDRLRYEVGVTAKVTRNIQLSKLQDARVDQRLIQRLWNVGDLSLETAGEASRLTISNVDDPQRLADEILNRAHGGSADV